jgi:hypothetical protein
VNATFGNGVVLSGLIEQSLLTAGEVGVQVIFLVIGAKQRPEFLAKRAPLSPTF